MKEKKYRVRLDEYERGILINSLLEMRNGLVREGKDAEPVNDLLLKIINAPKAVAFSGRRTECGKVYL